MENNNELNYEHLGLKVGLEIHQQLNTAKLFCNCPSEIREDAPDRTVKRILRASAGETGSIDIAAKHEMEKQKYFIYEYYDDTTCLVELDEQPPKELNKDALKIILQLSKITNAEIIDKIHVMRKTVVDGSNTSGFQRTALIARNGFIEVNNTKIRIESLCLEEDAARIIKKDDASATYRLDRLGVPLIEIATGPDINTPELAKETAGFIGMLLRSTGKVKRGLGTIRQDVNVSIKGGTRVEIKGVQDLRLLDEVVKLEVLRQMNMLKLREEFKDRKITENNFKNAPKDYSGIFQNTQCKFIKKGLDQNLKIYGKYYKNFKGFLGTELNPNRRFGSELSDRAKMFGLNGLIHTDENMEKYQIIDEVKNIYAELNLETEDSMIFILGTDDKCELAFKKIDETIDFFIRAGLSKEVRNAKEDGTSSFLRPMPGSSRMYPETDVPEIIPDLKNIEIPELIKDKTERFEKQYSLPKQVAKELVLEENFEEYVKKYPQIKPITIAEALVSMPKEIKTRYAVELNASEEQYSQIFEKLNENEITQEALFEILVEIAQGKKLDFSKYNTNEDEVVSFISKTISEKPNLNANAIMGLVMKEYRGKFSGQRILELIKKFKGE